MTDPVGTLKTSIPHTLGIGLVLMAVGCSLSSKKAEPVFRRAQLRRAAPVVDGEIRHEIASGKTGADESLAGGESRAGDESLAGDESQAGGESWAESEVTKVSAQSEHTGAGQSQHVSLPLAEEIRDEPIAPEPLDGNTEVIPTPEAESTGPLRLQDVIDSVYASYPLLEAASLARPIADGEVLSTWGEFDRKLKGGGTSGPLGFYKTHRYGAGMSQPLFSGGELFGGYKIGRGNFQPWFGERQTDDGGEFSAGVVIPLAQNRRIDARRAALWRATYGRDAVEPEIQTQTIAFIWQASYAYWQWVAAGQNHQIAVSLLKIAQQRNEGLEKRVEAGDLPRIVLTDNRRLIVSRQATLIDTQRKLRQSAIKLSLFLRAPNGEPMIPSEDLLPGAFPEAISVDPEQMESDIRSAMANRPELVFLNLVRTQLGVDLSQARNLYLPEVDAVLLTSKDIGGAASYKGDKTPFELEASLQVNVPLQRRKARGKIQAIEGKLQQVSVKIKFTQDKIATDVQEVYAALQAAFDRITRARESLQLARTMEEAEQRKFALGDSNLLLVNLRERATADAAKTVLQSLLDYFQAQADYRAAMALDVNVEGTSYP